MSSSSRFSTTAFILLLFIGLTVFWGEAIGLSLLIVNLNTSTFVTVLLLDAILWSIVAQLQHSLQPRLKNVTVLTITCLTAIGGIVLAQIMAEGYIAFFLTARIIANTLRHYTKTYLLPIYVAQHKREHFIKLTVSSRAVATLLGLLLIPLAHNLTASGLMNSWILVLSLTTLSIGWFDIITEGLQPAFDSIEPDYEARHSFHLRSLLQTGLLRWLTVSAFSVALLSTIILYQTAQMLENEQMSWLVTFFVGLGALGTVLMLPLQYRLFSLRQFSAGKLTLIYPGLLSTATSMLLALPSVITVGFGTVVRNNLRQSIHEPLERLLIHTLPGDRASCASYLLRSLVDPLGRIGGSLVIMFSITSSNRPEIWLFGVGVGTGIIYMAASQRAGFLYGKALATSLSAGRYSILRRAASEWELSDHTRVQSLIERLRQDEVDERERLLIAEVIAHSEVDEGYPILVDLFHHSPPFQQAELLPLIINGWPNKNGSTDNRLLVFQALDSDHPILRRQALRLILAYPELDPDFSVARFLLDSDPDVNVLAASILLRHPKRDVQNAARAQLRWLAKDQRVATRVLAVNALVWGSLDAYGDVVAPLNVPQYLQDPATRVRKAVLPAATTDQLIEAACNSSAAVRATAMQYLRQRRWRGARKRVMEAIADIRQQIQETGTMQIDLNLRRWRLLVALTHMVGGARHKHLVVELSKGFEQLSFLHTMQQTLAQLEQPAFLPLRQQLERDSNDLLITMIDYLAEAVGQSRVDAIIWTLESQTEEAAMAAHALENLTSPLLAQHFRSALQDDEGPLDTPHSILPAVVFKTLLGQTDEWHPLLAVYCLSKLPSNVRQNWLDDETTERVLTMGANSPFDVVRESTRLIQKVLETDSRHDQRKVDEGVVMLSTLERMLFLRNVSFFKRLHLDQLRALARGCEEVSADAGEYLIRQGDIGDGLYIVVEGEVRVERQITNGQIMNLGRLGPSEVFGEISLLDGDVRTADVIAEGPVLLLAIHRDALYAALEDDPQIAMTMLQTMAQRLRRTNEMIEQQFNTQD